MITKHNLKAVFNSLSLEEVEAAMDSEGDNVALEAYGYGCVSLNSTSDLSEEEVQEIEDSGNIVCDKDVLLRLFVESESLNPAFNDYI